MVGHARLKRRDGKSRAGKMGEEEEEEVGEMGKEINVMFHLNYKVY